MSLPLISSYSQRQGNPVDLVGGYGTGRQLVDVLAGGGAASIWTITFDGAGTFNAGSLVTATIYDDTNTGNVVTVSYTVLTDGASEAVVAQGFADAWNQTAGASNWMSAADTATVGGNEDVVLTGLALGQAFTVAITAQGGSTVTAAETQTATAREDVEPGRVMIQTYASGVALFDGTNQTPIGRRFKKSLFTAQSITWVVAGVDTAGARIVTDVMFRGVPCVVSTVYNASNDQTVTDHVAALETALNALYGAGTGLVATVSVAGSVKIAVDVAGSVFEATTRLDGPDTNATVVPTYAGSPMDPAYSLPAAYLGVSSWQPGTMPTSYTATTGVYLGGAAVPCWTGGSWLSVACDDSPLANQFVFVDGGTTNPGTMGDTAGTDAVAMCWPDGRKILAWSGQFTTSTARIVKGS